MSDFAPLRRERLADQVAAALRDAIVAGTYQPGDRLPAERELALRFGVNRSSVREALQQLSAWGLVDIRHGGGATVADVLGEAGLQLLPWLLAPDGRVDPRLMADLLEVRVALLGLTGELAARNAGDDDLAELTEITDRLAEAVGSRAIQALDYEFFEVLIRAGGNRVLQLVAAAIGKVYRENHEQFLALYRDDRIDPIPHRVTIAAIAERDPDRARAAMEGYGLAALAVLEDLYAELNDSESTT
jgi:DNA-binding FadR family transcriptional regulator